MYEPTTAKITGIRRRKTTKMNDSTTECNAEPLENEHEICTHDGILLKQACAEFISELNTSGSLSLIEYSPPKKLLYIEWKPNDSILITDDETQDQGEWSLVDTISRRQRTASECKVFNTKCDSPPKPKCLRVCLNDLKSIEVLSKGHTIRLMQKSDGLVHSEYFFQHGNADLFVRTLQQLSVLERIQNNKRVFEILDSEAQKLQKTFAELQIDDIKESGGWLSNMVSRNMDFLAKVSDLVPYQNQSHSLHQRSPNRNDDYEMLNQEKYDTENAKENTESELPKTDENRAFKKYEIPERKITTRGTPLTEKQWREFQTEDGRISDPQRIKEIVFRGGIEPSLRSEVWMYLLNYYQWGETTAERQVRRKKKMTEYYQMKAQWLSISVAQERNFSGYRDRKCQIEKDVKRTDRAQEFFAGEENPNLELLQDILMTYVMFNFDLGYVQGMSDLLAPILSVIQNEVDSFWCFVGFMEIVFQNFDIDQAGMKRQLNELNRLMQFCNNELYEYLKDHDSENMYFCFRWMLVWFKREFSTNDISELWECLWTGLPCPNFHLIIGLAILDEQKNYIIENKFEFNEILKHINELSMKINLKQTLEIAEAIYQQIKNTEGLTNEIRLIIGLEPIQISKDNGDNDSEECFDDILNELSPEDDEIRQQKFEEACDQSMFLSFL